MRPIIAYPGTEGSFSCVAAQEAFPDGECVGYETFPQAAQAAVDGRADYCLLPVENSFAGAVLATYQLQERLPLYVVAETMKPVRHQLLGVPGATLADVKQITSHPQAIAQCDRFLAGMKGVQITPSVNTAISAREVAQRGDVSYAAIASKEAAKAWNLQVLAENIQTSRYNTTRFFVLSTKPEPLRAPNKATVIFTVKNEVGSLVRVLSIFAGHGLNMSRIESRPLPESTFLYFFSADFEGELDEQQLRLVMDETKPYTEEIRLLGIYPKAQKPEL